MMQLSQEKSGQSILEIGIFGSIIISIIAAMLQYGLKYNFQQRAMMRAFRRSLAATGDWDRGNQGSVTYLQDRHIPNAGNLQGAVGSVLPFASSGSVMRNYQLINTPDHTWELPLSFIYVNNDRRPYTYTVARYKYETASEEQYKKLCEVYGDLYVKDSSNNFPDYSCPFGDIPICDPYGNCQPPPPCANSQPKTLRIMDGCLSDLISYDGCKRQCRMITNPTYCERECNRSKRPGDTKDCSSICSATIQTPWYCSQLDSIFRFALSRNKPPHMGIQPDSRQSMRSDGELRKSQSGGSITTTDSLSWTGTVDRVIASAPGGGPGVVQQPVNTRMSESARQSCTEGVCN